MGELPSVTEEARGAIVSELASPATRRLGGSCAVAVDWDSRRQAPEVDEPRDQRPVDLRSEAPQNRSRSVRLVRSMPTRTAAR